MRLLETYQLYITLNGKGQFIRMGHYRDDANDEDIHMKIK